VLGGFLHPLLFSALEDARSALFDFVFPTFKGPRGSVGAALVTSTAGLSASTPFIEVCPFQHCRTEKLLLADLGDLGPVAVRADFTAIVYRPIGRFEAVEMLKFISDHRPTPSTSFGAALINALHIRTTAAERSAGHPAVVATLPHARSLPAQVSDVAGERSFYLTVDPGCAMALDHFVYVPGFGMFRVASQHSETTFVLADCPDNADSFPGYGVLGLITERLPARRKL
jgi:hypothetical protein